MVVTASQDEWSASMAVSPFSKSSTNVIHPAEWLVDAPSCDPDLGTLFSDNSVFRIRDKFLIEVRDEFLIQVRDEKSLYGSGIKVIIRIRDELTFWFIETHSRNRGKREKLVSNFSLVMQNPGPGCKLLVSGSELRDHFPGSGSWTRYPGSATRCGATPEAAVQHYYFLFLKT
jgi:hypothetical protein